MPAFVHISDIHFGQEKRTGEVVVNDDIKRRLIEDAATQLRRLGKYPASGILVTGDIAYAGKAHQYREAGQWLDRLAEAIGCSKTAVHLVPGNHDVDRNEISNGVELMLKEILEKGEGTLDQYLSNPTDRKILYGRFNAYVPFAEAYDCPLDGEGGLAGDKPVPLGPGRVLRFIGLNTALTCAKGAGEEGRLVVGAKQRVLPKNPGEELVILAHHPMGWLQDGPDALRYIRRRARVLITGHEHNPSVRKETTPEGQELLVLAAGATVPPSNETLLYTYNIIDFSLDAGETKLVVSVHPRSWDDDQKEFDEDVAPLKGQQRDFPLQCPNFGELAPAMPDIHIMPLDDPAQQVATASTEVAEHKESQPVGEDYAYALLRFFRDLSPGQRVRVLVDLGALPDDWSEEISHGIERQVIDRLERSGDLSLLSAAMDRVESADADEGDNQQ